jgi:hypothetical protein
MWKVLEIIAEGELITKVRYFCSASDDKNTVETEGYWTFANPVLRVPLADVTEDMVAGWLDDDTTQDGINPIKSRLSEQLDALSKATKTALPWVQTYTPNL